MHRIILIFCLLFAFLPGLAQTTDSKLQEVIYGRRDGMALTLFVERPQAQNKKAVVYMVSGGYYSDARWLPDYSRKAQEFLKRGYTVFYVLHASAPMYSAVETVSDVQKAVQYIRFHASAYGIDPDKIAATGSSSGGNLALLTGTTDIAVPSSSDPLQRSSSKVNAVACFFPPTDFLNFRSPGNYALTDSLTQKLVREGWIVSAFMFKKLDKSNNTYHLVADTDKKDYYKMLSPIYGIDAAAAPTFIVHGDHDQLVPIYQSERFIARMKEAGRPAEMVVRKGAGHGWEDTGNDMKLFADWFDKQLN